MKALHTSNAEGIYLSGTLNASTEQEKKIISWQDAKLKGTESKIDTFTSQFPCITFLLKKSHNNGSGEGSVDRYRDRDWTCP